ncbi:hypothetical protein Tco_1192441 [Tanacetum coccineum]
MDYSNKNHVRKFLRALPLKWRAKVTTIKEAKDLAILLLDELIGNLKVYKMILASDDVSSKPIKEKVMPIALKVNVATGQTSNDTVCKDGSDKDEDGEEEFNSIVRNLWKLFKKGNRFERENHFVNSGDKFDRGRGGRSKGVGSSRRERSCYGCGSKNHLLMVVQERRRTFDQLAGGKLRDKNDKESWALLEDLALYDNESWNDPKDLGKLVKAISLPQDVPSTFDRCLIELENQVQRLLEAHLAPKSHVQVNKITSLCEIYSGPHDTQYCMENLEQAFVLKGFQYPN